MSIFSSFPIKGMNILRINLWITMLVIPNMTNKERLRYQGCNHSLELEGQIIQWPKEKVEKR